MNKIMVLTVFAVLSFFQYGNAQDVNFGAKAGMNFANLTGGNSERLGKVDFHVGFVTEFVFRRGLFGAQPELLYSRQGSSSGSNSLDYISLPLMLKFFPLKSLSMDIGPQYSFLINGKDTGANNADFGVNIGLGYDLKNNVFAQARYNLGITNAYGDLNNSVFQFSVGYKF
ncbi:porin family protein [uncultured Gelidibacter sp.]|uniref:porin family protein n=1 Tax=uncultured Gelidibacter sp. TaxID=259318 RepID=UPI002635B1F0|nr:porin family protein [uncultured Gelidibacter sp.]